MEEWKEYKLGDFMEFNPKISLKKNTVARKITMDQLVPHSRDIYSWTYEPYSGGAKFQNGDTIMARITPCLENGKHAFISLLEENEIAYGSTEYIVIRGRCGISDNRFVYYLTHYPSFKEAAVKSMVGSSGRQRAQVDVLENLTMKLPAIPEQRRIAEALSILDDKIKVNKRINDNLEQQAQALFKHWFVDFAPFKDGKFVESELGLIPEGWRVGTLGDICTYSKIRIPIDNLNPKTYYSTENMLPNKMGAVEASSLPQVGMATGCEPFDVLVSNIRPYFKKILRVDSICGCSSDVMCFHAIDSKYRAYLYRTLYDDSFFSYVMSGSKGTKMPRGDKQQIMKYSIVLPQESVLEHFSNCVEPMFSMISSFKQESSRLATLRDTLLPKLMSGEIKVNEIEKSL